MPPTIPLCPALLAHPGADRYRLASATARTFWARAVPSTFSGAASTWPCRSSLVGAHPNGKGQIALHGKPTRMKRSVVASGPAMIASRHQLSTPTPIQSRPDSRQPRFSQLRRFYSHELGEFLLRYDDVRCAPSPEQALLEFFQSTYEAGATLAHWDREALRGGWDENNQSHSSRAQNWRPSPTTAFEKITHRSSRAQFFYHANQIQADPRSVGHVSNGPKLVNPLDDQPEPSCLDA